MAWGLLLGIVIGAVIGYLFARGRVADLIGRARAAEQRAALLDTQLAERFQALSTAALDASTSRFLQVAEGRLQAANANASAELETRRAALVEHLVETCCEEGRLEPRWEAQLRGVRRG